MKFNKKNIIILMFLILACSTNAGAFANVQDLKEAEKFVVLFNTRANNYDTKILDMYSDNAKIIRNIQHNNGKTEKIIIPTDKYKKFLNFVRYFAKIRHYKNTYKNIECANEGENIRVNALRVNSNKYSTPISLLLAKDSRGEFKIIEEETSTKSLFLINELFLRF